jgi:EAL domain-containing protein (putative c-di-GMP-specific phosphodiesterase class I)
MPTSATPLRMTLAAGDVLFREGDAATTAFLVESGELEISMLRGAERVTLSRLGAGDLLGEMAVIDDAPRTATATAVRESVLFPIDKAQIAERLADTDPIIRALLEGQLKRYRGALAAMQGSVRDYVDLSDTPSESAGIDKIRLETHLREAIAANGLALRYQPLLHVASGRIAGYEALVRWTHPERGPIPPNEFVALAEETSLIVPVGEYVFDAACRAVRRLHDAGHMPVPFVAVNVSARQLAHPGLVERIVGRVEAAGLPRGSLKVEITESQAFDIGRVGAVIDMCHAHGIRVALDDFGTGWSNLAHLPKLRFDTLKIDQAFSRTMLTDPRVMAIVEAIVRMARALEADVVMEGIESRAMLDALKALGCDYAQGYHVGRPQALEDLLAAS